MAIDINGLTSSQTQQRTRSVESLADKRSQQSDQVIQSSDDAVNLSDHVKTLQAIEANLKTQPDIDQGRVEALRSAIERGEFSPQPRQIAEKIVSLEEKLSP